MRSSKSRSRSKANRPRTLGNIVNRVFDSSGPEGKVRGTPAQIIEKYQFLARDAQLGNDRVAAENFSQHAEHYTRMLAEAMREQQAEQEARQQYQQNQPVPQSSGNGTNGNQNAGNQNAGHQNPGNQNAGNQNPGNRDRDYAREGSRDNRFDRNRDDRYDRVADNGGGLGPVIDAEDDGDIGPVPTPETVTEPRQDRPRYDAPRPPRAERADRPERNDRSEHRPVQTGPSEVAAQPVEDQPRRAPRPYPPRVRNEPAEQPGLPAFITGASETAAAAPAEAEKPKAPRAPRRPAAAKTAAPINAGLDFDNDPKPVG